MNLNFLLLLALQFCMSLGSLGLAKAKQSHRFIRGKTVYTKQFAEFYIKKNGLMP